MATINTDEFTVAVWQGEDGVPVVQIDTFSTGRVRVNLNEAPIWDGDPDLDSPPGANIAAHYPRDAVGAVTKSWARVLQGEVV